jgi:hypothetical protein
MLTPSVDAELSRSGTSLLFFRGVAALVASFAVINALGAAVQSDFSAAYILFHVPGAPALADVCLALLLVGSAFGPVKSRAALVGFSAPLFALAAVAGFNAAEFYGLLLRGRIATAWPVPLSLVLMIYIVLHIRLCVSPRYRHTKESALRPPSPRARARRRASGLAAVGAALSAVFAVIVFHVHALGLTAERAARDA